MLVYCTRAMLKRGRFASPNQPSSGLIVRLTHLSPFHSEVALLVQRGVFRFPLRVCFDLKIERSLYNYFLVGSVSSKSPASHSSS